jgi:hypothetical protein
MNHKERTQTLEFIRPKAIFVLRGDELEWLDKHQSEPTEAEIEAGWTAYQATQQAEAEAKATAKAELLERLGITADEAKLLLA